MRESIRSPAARFAAAAIASLAIGLGASAAHAQATTLGSTDFTMVLSRMDPSGAYDSLTSDQLTNLLSAARCACPINLSLALGINADSVAKLGAGDSLTAQIEVGSNCDNSAVTTCISIGTQLTLSADTTSAVSTFSTANLFTAVLNGANCSAVTATATQVWAIVRQNGVLLASQPYVSVGVGSPPPAAPTAPTATTADSGLLVSWTAPSTTTSIQGYQVLCSPGPSSPPSASFDSCAAGQAQGGTGPFATLDPTLICSGLVSVGTNSARVKGLQNGTAYQVAVISIGSDGTPSLASDTATATPGPTLGFDDLYKQDGGTGLVACAIGGARAGEGMAAPTAALCALGLVVAARRRRPRRRRGRPARRGFWRRIARGSLGALVLVLLTAGAARAGDDEDDPDKISHGYRFGEEPEVPAFAASPRNWNFELRFGPYFPGVDSEFSDRGSTAHPFEQTFSSKQRLMWGLELDRQLFHRGGTWSAGFGFGFYNASASSLSADQLTRTGDETSLRFYPLSVMAVYRADFLHERYSSPIVPYAKLGLDCAIWSISDTAKSSSLRGRTFGWNAAVGIALDLSFIDPDGMKTMDTETGVNGISVFGELTHLGLDGFGSSSVLRLSDTTWVAGLMIEM